MPSQGGGKPSSCPSWVASSLASTGSAVPCMMPRARLGLHWVLWCPFKLSLGCFSPFQANIGQKEDFEAARKKALGLGAKKVTASLPPGAQGALSSPCSPPWG